MLFSGRVVVFLKNQRSGAEFRALPVSAVELFDHLVHHDAVSLAKRNERFQVVGLFVSKNLDGYYFPVILA